MTIFSLHTVITLLILISLEVVLGIDNLVFISIVTNRLVKHQQTIARRVGLLLALLTRLLLLSVAFVLVNLTKPLVILFSHGFSVKDIFLILGAIFLWIKSIEEIKNALKLPESLQKHKAASSFTKAVIQIMVFDILFSLDSIITAVGIAKQFWVMALAIVIAVLIMIFASNIISYVINKHKRIKMLALCFLLLIGAMLFLDGFGIIIPMFYIYSAMGFAVLVEVLNIVEENAVSSPRRRGSIFQRQ